VTRAGQLGIAFLLLGIAVAVGVVGYWISGLGWEDAIYQTMVTVTTVGYEDAARPLGVRWFTIFMLGFGTMSIAVFISLLTGVVIDARIREIIGRRKVESKVRKLTDHVILCGFGRFGRIIGAELERRGVPFVVLETDAVKAAGAREHGILVVEADATEEETLEQAGLIHCRGLLTTLPTDAENVYVALVAKQLKPKLHVVALARDEAAVARLRAAGADEVVSPYRLGGTWMAQMITSPTVHDFMKIATGLNPLNFSMDEQRIGEDSSLGGRLLRDTPIRSELGVIVLAVRRATGELVTNPPPDIVLNPGDVLVSLGEQENLERLNGMATGG
jgi:voltage-gated potassium channel